MAERNQSFEHEIGYNFNSQALLEEALRAPGNTTPGDKSLVGNKRLALVGDSVVAVMLLDRWYKGGSSTGISILSLAEYKS
jgi:dsRNA-specific ribonuclease